MMYLGFIELLLGWIIFSDAPLEAALYLWIILGVFALLYVLNAYSTDPSQNSDKILTLFILFDL